MLDSSCWIEYYNGSQIGESVAPFVERTEELIVPTIVLFEVSKYLLVCNTDESRRVRFIETMKRGLVIPLDADLGLDAAETSHELGLPMADSIIYTTARQHNALLWTADQHFEGLPGVYYFPPSRE